MVANPPKPTQEPTKQSTKQPMEKQKELRYAKVLLKNKAEGSSAPYALMCWLNWPTFRPESPFMSFWDRQSQQGKLWDKI